MLTVSSAACVSAKHEKIESPGLVYAFVDFASENPCTWLIPSSVVADYVRTSHASWLATPGRNGRPHNPTDMRRLDDRPQAFAMPKRFAPGWLDQYREQWTLLTPESEPA